MTVSFESPKLFMDKKNFPYGFARSGMFTKNQTLVLERNGVAYTELANGTRTPVTEDEKNFVAFCKGDKPAESEHEKVWKTYLSQIGRKVSYLSMETGKHKPAADLSEDFSDETDVA